MIADDLVGMGVYWLPPIETDTDVGDTDWSANPSRWPDLNLALYPWLMRTQQLVYRSIIQSWAKSAITNVAEMPGYPTRKLLLGGPETRTNAETGGPTLLLLTRPKLVVSSDITSGSSQSTEDVWAGM